MDEPVVSDDGDARLQFQAVLELRRVTTRRAAGKHRNGSRCGVRDRTGDSWEMRFAALEPWQWSTSSRAGSLCLGRALPPSEDKPTIWRGNTVQVAGMRISSPPRVEATWFSIVGPTVGHNGCAQALCV